MVSPTKFWTVPPVVLRVSRLHDGAVQANERGLVRRVEGGGVRECRNELLGPPGVRSLTLQREGRARFLRVQVVHRPRQHGRAAGLREGASLVAETRVHRGLQLRGQPHGRAECRPAEQVVRDPMAPGIAAFGDHVPEGIKHAHVVSGTRVFQIQRPAGEDLVEEPCPPAEGARGLRSHPVLDHGGFDFPEGRDQDTQIECLVAERETQVGDDRVVRCVSHRIELDRTRTVRFRAPCPRDDVALDGGTWYRQAEVAEEPGLADGAASCVRHGVRRGESMRKVVNLLD